MMTTPTFTPCLLVACALGITLGACEGERKPTYAPRNRAAGTAVLPPTPDLNPKLPPASYGDGAWSVHGVLETGTKLPADGVRVRGYVAALHTCPAGVTRCNPAPFVQLTDAENLQGRRLLVGGPLDPARDALKVGQLATLAGKFVTRSADGLYFAPGGMLHFSVPEPPGDAPAAGPGGGNTTK